MDIRKLSGRDIHLLMQLDIVTSKIYDKYKDIINNNNEENISDLKVLKKAEDDILNELNNPENYDVYAAIYDTKLLFEPEDNSVLSYNVPELNLHLYRPITTLKRRFKTTTNYFKQSTVGEDIEDLNGEIFKKLQAIYLAFDTESFVLYLSFLEDYIESTKDEELKNQLKTIKYDILFGVRDIENKFIDNNLKIPKDVYIDSHVYAKLFNISDDTYYALLDEYVRPHFFETLAYVSNLNDEYFDGQKSYVNLIDKLANLKVSFMYLTDEELKDFKEVIDETLKDDENKQIIYKHLVELYDDKHYIRSRHNIVN